MDLATMALSSKERNAIDGGPKSVALWRIVDEKLCMFENDLPTRPGGLQVILCQTLTLTLTQTLTQATLLAGTGSFSAGRQDDAGSQADEVRRDCRRHRGRY